MKILPPLAGGLSFYEFENNTERLVFLEDLINKQKIPVLEYWMDKMIRGKEVPLNALLLEELDFHRELLQMDSAIDNWEWVMENVKLLIERKLATK